MNMNPVGIKCLQDIKKVPAFKDAIIAGGMVRDYLMKGNFTDIDIYIPFGIKSDNQLNKALMKLIEIGDFSDINYSTGLKYQYSSQKFNKVDAKYLGKIDVDIMVYPFDSVTSTKKFGDFITDNFNYGIDQCYFDGDIISITSEARRDIENYRATLLKCDDVLNLPNSMAKFFKLKQKYKDLAFNTYLKLTDSREHIPMFDHKFNPFKSNNLTGLINDTTTSTAPTVTTHTPTMTTNTTGFGSMVLSG